MKFFALKNSSLEIAQLVARINASEAAFRMDLMRQEFAEIWEDIEQDPDFSEFPAFFEAELLLAAGCYLFNEAKTRESDFGERAKNLITRAIIIFQDTDSDKADEAQIKLAFAYYQNVEDEEFKDIIESLRERYENNQMHPNYHLLYANLLLAYFNFDYHLEARDILEKQGTQLGLSRLPKIRYMFHLHAAMIYGRTDDYEKAESHYISALGAAKELQNPLLLGKIYNNVACLLSRTDRIEEALEFSRLGNEIFKSHQHFVFYAHGLDTRAQILYRDGRFDEALTMITKSIMYFKKYPDIGLTEALMWRIRILLAQNKSDAAWEAYHQLLEEARTRGSAVVRKYTNQFKELFYYAHGKNFFEKNREFEKHQIVQALRKSDLNVRKASTLLGFPTPWSIYQKLTSKFPEIYDELQMPRRAHSPHAKIEEFATDKLIHYAGNKAELKSELTLYTVPEILAREIFNEQSELILAVDQSGLRQNEMVLFKIGGELLVGTFQIKERKVKYLNKNKFVDYKKGLIVGRILSYCDISESDKAIITFR